MSIIKPEFGEEALAKENMRVFLNGLDLNNRKIFWHLRWYRHARITELTKLIPNSNDMEILYRLRDVINPAAVRVFGNTIIEFNNSKIDDVSGEKILFNWWISDFLEDYRTQNVAFDKTLIDIFDEDDKIIIISDIDSSVKVRDTAIVEQRNGILSIRLEKIL